MGQDLVYTPRPKLCSMRESDPIPQMSGEARVRALEVEFGAELSRLEGLISIAELNNR